MQATHLITHATRRAHVSRCNSRIDDSIIRSYRCCSLLMPDGSNRVRKATEAPNRLRKHEAKGDHYRGPRLSLAVVHC